MGLGYTDKNLRLNLADTFLQIPVSHTGIYQDNDCTDLEKSKGKCNELKGRFDHQHDPVSPVYSQFGKPVGKPVCSRIHLAEGPGSVATSCFTNQAGSVGVGLGCFRKHLCNIMIHSFPVSEKKLRSVVQ